MAAVLLGLSIAFLGWIAIVIPWTPGAVVAWLLTAPVILASTVVHLPLVARLAVAILLIGWGLIIFFPDRSPLGPLSRSEWACQKVILAVRAGARSAYGAGSFAGQRPEFVARLEALAPPNESWAAVKVALLLDLRQDPPQVGGPGANETLVMYPWRNALDHRILPIRLRIDDVLRARRLHDIARPAFDQLTSSMRYDYYFLRRLWIRFDALKSREGGLPRWHREASALSAFAETVRPPDDGWMRLRDLTVQVMDLELRPATAEMSTVEREDFASAGDELREEWAKRSARDARGLPWADDDSGG